MRSFFSRWFVCHLRPKFMKCQKINTAHGILIWLITLIFGGAFNGHTHRFLNLFKWIMELSIKAGNLRRKKTEMFLSTEPCLMDNFDMISFYLRSFFGDVLERVCWTIKSFNRHLKYTHTKCLFCCAILVRHSIFPGLSLCLQWIAIGFMA